MSISRIVFVAGISGAGKSQAMKSLEDIGFACVDNLPPVLIEEMIALAEQAAVESLAIAPDIRTGGSYGDVSTALDRASVGAASVELLFLDASDDVLVRRYSETRRRHPFYQAQGVGDAIALERTALANLRDRADVRWDTSRLTYTALKAKVAERFGTTTAERRLTISILAFGFKHGLPLDADLVFDVRFLENPNYVPELKALTGADAPVAEFLEALPETEMLIERLSSLLEFLVPEYIREGKSHLTIAVGCTGGRHRSVYVARRLLAVLQNRPQANVHFEARDLPR